MASRRSSSRWLQAPQPGDPVQYIPVHVEAAPIVELAVNRWIKHMLLLFEEEPPVTVYCTVSFAVATERNPQVVRPDLSVVDAISTNSLDV
jgi:hypothetical protein